VIIIGHIDARIIIGAMLDEFVKNKNKIKFLDSQCTKSCMPKYCHFLDYIFSLILLI